MKDGTIVLLNLVLMSSGTGGVAWRRGSKVTGTERRAAGATQRTGGGAQRAGAATQPGPSGTAGAGDSSGTTQTTGLRL